MTDTCRSFREHCASGIEVNHGRLDHYVKNSLMLVTALSPRVGYDKAAKIAHVAHVEHTSLRAAAIKLGFLTGEEFDQWVKAEEMISPSA